jgi:hypothetical protein
MTNPSKYKEICLAWHRRAGKDEIGMHAAMYNAMRRVGNYWHMLPKAEQCRRAIWEAVNPHTKRLRWKDAFPLELVKRVDNQTMRLEFLNGSTWQLLGSDNFDNIVGAPPVGIFYSEAALANSQAFGMFRPILLENGGQASYVSSVRGRNHFYNIFQSLKVRDDAYVSLLPATESGVFTPETLAQERNSYIDLYGEAYGTSLFDQEYMCSWDASTIGTVWGPELIRLRKQGRARPCTHDAKYPVHTSWDLGVSTSDPTIILFWQTVGTQERLIDWLEGSSTGMEFYAQELKSRPYFYDVHVAPHDIINREWGSGETRIAYARRFGIDFTKVPRVQAKLENVGYGSTLIDKMVINIDDETADGRDNDCHRVLDAISQYRFKFDPDKKILSSMPEHDWTSHFADALSTYGHYTATRANGGERIMVRQQGLIGDGAKVTQDILYGKWALDKPKSRATRGAWL